MIIQPGTDIGRYHILEQLGQGGMAIVYKAYDTQLEREIAIKFIRTDNILPKAIGHSLKRFQIEAKKMASLSHPNIVKILDFGEYQHAPFLVMEYISGGTLKQKLGKPIPWRTSIHLLKPIAEALAYAHRKGLVHRDVKPANILIAEDGQPILTDFGIAKILESEETLDHHRRGHGDSSLYVP
jgi:serine/threonine protein kinase